MIDIDPASTCRICLEDGAIYPIFESNNKFEGIYDKLATCIREKITNTEGYPQNICIKCKNTSDTICSFVSKFEENCKILENNIIRVKTEKEDVLDISDNDFDNNEDNQELVYELQIDNVAVKPEPEKQDPTELLESLKHLTVKKIKVNSEAEINCSVGVKKNLRPNLTSKSLGKVTKTKKVDCKATVVKKSATKPTKAKVKKKEMSTPGPVVEAGKAHRTQQSSQGSQNIIIESGHQQDQLNTRHTINVIGKIKKTNSENAKTTALCDACGEVFEDKNMLQKHMHMKHTEKKFKCSKCMKAYCSGSRLREHLKSHQEKIHICQLCKKGFSLKKTLNGHIRYVHQNVRPKMKIVKCQFCDRIFASKRCALIHERSIHTGERPEVCSVCDGRFYDTVYLKQHMLIHTGETPFKCPVCGQGYTQLCNMKSHMRNHKSNKLLEKQRDSPFGELCEVCGKSFACKWYLSQHMRIHTGVKPYSCPVCEKTFTQDSSMRSHVFHNHRLSDLDPAALTKIKLDLLKHFKP